MKHTPGNPIPSALQSLFEAARDVRRRAYAPYSHFQVGTTIRLSDGKTYSGANWENSSFGATVCAERSAIGVAVANGGLNGSQGGRTIDEVFIVAESDRPVPPCGICRQSLNEFAGPGCKIYMSRPDGSGFAQSTLGELLPHAFGRSDLPPT